MKMKKTIAILAASLAILMLVSCPQKTDPTPPEPAKPKTYTVTFNSNEGKGEMAPQIFTENEPQAISKNKFYKEDGETFFAWYYWDSQGNDVWHKDQEVITVTQDITLIASWMVSIYTITFDANGGVGEMQPLISAHNMTKQLTENAFTREGYTFLGWSTSPDGEKVYSDKEYLTTTRDMTLYAVWKANTSYVTFNSNGGIGYMPSQKFIGDIQQSLSENTFTREDYMFLGWATSDIGEKVYDDKQAITVTRNMTLYAVWEKVELSLITVEPIFTGEYVVGDTITNEDILVIAYYTNNTSKKINNWTTDETFEAVANNKTITIFYTEDGITKEATLVITIINGYEITYTPSDTMITLDGHNGSAGSSWTYVQLGDWPQTVKADSVEILERQKKQVGFFTYHAGSDGNWYVKQSENAHSTGKTYTYTNGKSVNQGGTSSRYFKVEPIKWRVLEEKNGKKFLLAERGLIAIPYYDIDNYRFYNGRTIKANNYMHSKVRAFLNGLEYPKDDVQNGILNTYICSDYQGRGFLQTAFTSDVQNKIVITHIDNSVASTGIDSNTDTCNNTDDKVFLLSAKEAYSADYGFPTSMNSSDRSSLIRIPTDFALATGAESHNYVNTDEIEWECVWWLRSPFGTKYATGGNQARYITQTGYITDARVSETCYSIVPAMWVE